MTTVTPDLIPVEVCTDCLMVIANGEHTDCAGGDCASCTAPGFYALGGDELGFCATDCDRCHAHLAGDRFTAYYEHTN